MTTPNELTPLSDPDNVRFIIVDDADDVGFSPSEVQALMNASPDPGELLNETPDQ